MVRGLNEGDVVNGGAGEGMRDSVVNHDDAAADVVFPSRTWVIKSVKALEERVNNCVSDDVNDGKVRL